MALIHRTTMRPTKQELVAAWLPTREWYVPGTGEVRPVAVGGFRLDDPAGEVGVEFMAVADGEGPDAVVYLVPMTYRGKPLDGAEGALIGTSEHGVLGTRWIYDGAHDPVLVAQAYALLAGRAAAQHRSLSDTPDPTVTAVLDPAPGGDAEALDIVDGADRTDVRLRTDGSGTALVLRFHRVLRPAETGAGAGAVGRVTAAWTPGGGSPVRGDFLTVHPV
ncbi:1,4-alpha-glucan branching protein [Streptomyces termitum]|uniref:Maltokinase N-terminal cap domain-containing protein n=1 Tax=Streptomyces termitum TaxID=67368 RepID=A0A918SZ06_9ACTN|nr:1,4-alpha-glucan branching protein [Streptomyces termitum]GHA78137.1 hypothetical protein GCM10010305_21670 [Streptomyces termitum]